MRITLKNLPLLAKELLLFKLAKKDYAQRDKELNERGPKYQKGNLDWYADIIKRTYLPNAFASEVVQGLDRARLRSSLEGMGHVTDALAITLVNRYNASQKVKHHQKQIQNIRNGKKVEKASFKEIAPEAIKKKFYERRGLCFPLNRPSF